MAHKSKKKKQRAIKRLQQDKRFESAVRSAEDRALSKKPSERSFAEKFVLAKGKEGVKDFRLDDLKREKKFSEKIEDEDFQERFKKFIESTKKKGKKK